MGKILRFEKAADNHRPFRSHRYEVWSPKIARSLTIFGKTPLNAWLYIESVPEITCFCERPLVVTDSGIRRVVDYWVSFSGKEEMWLLKTESEINKLKKDNKYFEIFVKWSRHNNIESRFIDPTNVQLDLVAFNNWASVIHSLSANYDIINQNQKLQDIILSLCTPKCSLKSLQSELNNIDPVVIQTTTFYLLHKGYLISSDIYEIPLTLQTEFARR